MKTNFFDYKAPNLNYPSTIKALVLFVLMMLISCQKKHAGPLDPNQILKEKGESIYENICAACHGNDPKLSGPIGPEVWGSSYDLLKEKIVHQKYPAGYMPKRKTNIMPAFKHLESEINAIFDYLNTNTETKK